MPQQVQTRRSHIIHMQNPRRGLPVPQFVTEAAPAVTASSYRRINAGNTCDPVREKLSPGPYKTVGIAEIHGNPHCRRTACTCMIPANFAAI